MLAMLAALMLAAGPQHDTVFTADGGRILGTVIEESPQAVAIQMLDGTVRRLPSRDVVRIEYADGSVSFPLGARASVYGSSAPPSGPPAGAPPPPPRDAPLPPPVYAPAPPPGYAPPPDYAPPRPPPPSLQGTARPISPVWVSFSMGGSFFEGAIARGVGVGRIFGPQLDFGLEGGLRLDPHFGLGLYADAGFGDTGPQVNAFCNADPASPGGGLGGAPCTTTTVNAGVLARYTFVPYAHVTPWLSVGTGFAYGNVSIERDSGGYSGDGGSYSDLANYTGWEIARLMVGVDVRGLQLGAGVFAGVSFTRYMHVENVVGTWPLDRTSLHMMFEAGVRLTLPP